MTQIKICGFTDPKEAAFVSYPDVSYMGMVLFFMECARPLQMLTPNIVFFGNRHHVVFNVSLPCFLVRQVQFSSRFLVKRNHAAVHGDMLF